MTASDARFVSNAAVLVGAYMIIWQQKSFAAAWRPFEQAQHHTRLFAPFHDASYWPSDFDVTVKDTLQGIAKAFSLGWIDFSSFNFTKYVSSLQYENGDFTEVVPGKFVAFAGPTGHGKQGFTPPPDFYCHEFKQLGVKTIVRTNDTRYDKREFTRAGFKHHDLVFPDGTPPPEAAAKTFLRIAETSPGSIGVHCKAGLGRTGSLILMYVMKHYRFTAKEAIGYLRWMRPGSIIGPQQQWLSMNEQMLWKMGVAEGEVFRMAGLHFVLTRALCQVRS